MRPRCSTWSAQGTSTAASPIPRTPCWSSASRPWKAAWAPSPSPAARRRCTCRWPRSWGAGSHIVASTALYGGSQNLLHYTLARFGIETTFVKPGDIDGWRAAVRPNTKLFFGETVGNPGLDVLDIPTISAIAHEAGVPLLVGLHADLALADEAARAWRGHRLPLGHQVPVGPRHRGRRHRGGWRQLRLGKIGTLPGADRALRRFPQHGVQRGKAAPAPSCCARGAKACATSAPA